MATSAAYAANATEPVTMSFTVGPERYSAPPVEIWMMPSAPPASAKPLRAALSVWDEETLIAGEGEGAGLGGVEHLGVLLGSGDGHAGGLLRQCGCGSTFLNLP